MEKRLRAGDYTPGGIYQYAFDKIKKISDELGWVFGEYYFFAVHNLFLNLNYHKDSEIAIGFSYKNQENSPGVCFIKITFPRKLGSPRETKLKTDEFKSDEFNIKASFRDIWEGERFKSEFGNFYIKKGPQRATCDKGEVYAFLEYEPIFITENQRRRKEYVFKHDDKCFILKCYGYSLESAIKNHNIMRNESGWYLLSIDGVPI